MKLLAAGHSHLSALIRAHYALLHRDELPDEVEAYFMRLNTKANEPNFSSGPREITPNLKKRITFVLKREAPDEVVLATMGNEYNSIALLQHPEPFDFETPFGPEARLLGADPIPYSAIRRFVEDRARINVGLFINTFAEVYGGPIKVLPPPPPNPSEAHIRNNPGSFAERVKEHGVSPAPLRLKIWRLYVDILRQLAEDAGPRRVEVADLPAEIFDDNGFLAERYWHRDPTHGNATYGHEVYRHLMARHGIELPDPRIHEVAED
ncbi:hypothetical protein [Vannielia sp. SX4]|uniref:hypothetical protein n=1 Tax=Vannielia sp. SX4 TaxID=3463852 RepID=UPI004059E58A